MDKQPLLIFPKPDNADKTPGTKRMGGSYHFPSKEIQIGRINPVMTELDKVLVQKSVFLQQDITNAVPEMVLVLEIRGTIDNFFSAVKKTAGLEFLSEYEADFEANKEFYVEVAKDKLPKNTIHGQVFLVMTNQTALNELKRYWDLYVKGNNFKKGTAKFRTLFEQLSDIRPYCIKDRLQDTGFIEYLAEMQIESKENIKFEIELFYRENILDRKRVFSEIDVLLKKHNGQILNKTNVEIHEIRYHAFIAEAPLQAFSDLSENTNITFLQCEHVMFLRPVGQIAISNSYDVDSLPDVDFNDIPIKDYEPVVALLDGLPLANHSLLKDRILLEDPDDFELEYQANERIHGTTMASLIIHGDINEPDELPLTKPLYIRPIMKPDIEDSYHKPRPEIIPRDILPVDIIHRSVKRMIDGDDNTIAVAPKIKIINLSIGDPLRPFHINMSAWAKLLDWLSIKYNILFIISAGNVNDNFELDISQNNFAKSDNNEKQKLTLKAIIENNYLRKILTPAESINGLTVGASCYDSSLHPTDNSIETLIYQKDLLSPFSRIGFGFKMGIKPDILMPGGRMLYRLDPRNTDITKTIIKSRDNSITSIPPGQKVAVPGQPGELSKYAYTRGTSNAAALTTRLGAKLYDILQELNHETPTIIDEVYFPVLIKSLIVHGARWGEGKSIIDDILKNYQSIKSQVRRNHIVPYLGYGFVDNNRVLYCTEQRVTLLGYGSLEKEKAHLYELPLPYSLSGNKFWKRLVITLAWLSPLNTTSNKYRKAQLYFDNYNPSDTTRKINIPLNLIHENVGYDISRKGTVQHDVLEGDEIDTFINGTNLEIKINCKEDANGLGKEKVKYGIAVTLEVKENNPILIYQEIQQAINQKIRITG